MDRVPQIMNKGKKADRQFLDLEFQPVTFFSRHLRSAICVLVLSAMVFVEPAASHPGVAPEIDEITHELEKNPTSVELLIKRGQLYRFNNDLLNSLDDFEQAAQLEPGNPEALFQRGLTLAALGRDVEAELALDQFLLLSGEGAEKRAIAMAERAHIRARTGRTDLALSDYTSAIHILPVVELYQARGHLQESQGKLADAAAGYREGLSRLPHAILLKKSLIRVEIARQQFAQALLLIDEELAQASVKTAWYLRRGEVLEAMGQPDEARVAREQALAGVNQTMTKRVTAIHRLSRAKVLLALGRLDEAKSDLQMALQVAPNLAEARDLLQKLEES